MKITNMEFSKAETAAIYALAGAALKDDGLSRKEALAYIATLTPQNVLRLALGLPERKRGGARAGGFETGNTHARRRYCGDCKRAGRGKVEVWKNGVCKECWHAQADAKAAAI